MGMPEEENGGMLDIAKPPGHPNSPHPRAEDQPTIDDLPASRSLAGAIGEVKVELSADLESPNVEELKALRAAVMGDEFSTEVLDSGIAKIDAILAFVEDGLPTNKGLI